MVEPIKRIAPLIKLRKVNVLAVSQLHIGQVLTVFCMQICKHSIVLQDKTFYRMDFTVSEATRDEFNCLFRCFIYRIITATVLNEEPHSP